MPIGQLRNRRIGNRKSTIANGDLSLLLRRLFIWRHGAGNVAIVDRLCALKFWWTTAQAGRQARRYFNGSDWFGAPQNCAAAASDPDVAAAAIGDGIKRHAGNAWLYLPVCAGVFAVNDPSLVASHNHCITPVNRN